MKLLKPTRLSRRALLKGLGVSLALPFLDVMRPARAQSTSDSPRRLFFMFGPCGVDMRTFTPRDTGRDFSLSRMLEPLSDVKDRVLVVSGARNTAAMDLGDGPGDHARGTGAFLTACHPHKSESRVQNGISVDQVAAQALRGQTRLSSLELGTQSGSLVGSCDVGYSCAYANNISWASPTVPMPKEVNPRAVFDRLFQSAEAGLTPEEREARRRRRSSVLDFVRDDTRRLEQKVGVNDRRKLDEYLTSVRELERSIEDAPAVTCELPEQPAGAEADLQKYMRQMMDLVVLAYRCDLTRIATLMIGNGASDRSYAFLGHPGTHHEYSHHQDDPDKLEALADIGRFQVAQLAYLANKLDAIDEGDGTALDHSTLMFSSELEDGNAHSHENLPCLLVGKGGGLLDTNRHIEVDPSTEMGDVYLTLLRTVGVHVESFGQYGTRLVDEMLLG